MSCTAWKKPKRGPVRSSLARRVSGCRCGGAIEIRASTCSKESRVRKRVDGDALAEEAIEHGAEEKKVAVAGEALFVEIDVDPHAAHGRSPVKALFGTHAHVADGRDPQLVRARRLAIDDGVEVVDLEDGPQDGRLR